MRTMPLYLGHSQRLLSGAALTLFAACSSSPVAPLDRVPDGPLERPTAVAAPSPALEASAYLWSESLAAAARTLRGELPSGTANVAQSADQRLWVSFPTDALFAPGRSALKATATAWLDRIASITRTLPRSEVQIFGEADPQSRNDRASHALALDRAASARDWMVARGLPARRIAVAGRHLASQPAQDTRRLDILIGERAAPVR